MSYNPAAGPGPQGPQYSEQTPQKKGKKKWVIGCLGLIVLAIILFAGCAALVSGETEDPVPATNETSSAPSPEATEDTRAVEETEAAEAEAEAAEAEARAAEAEAAEAEAAEAEAAEAEQNAEQSSLTVAQQNAVRTAEQYVDFSAFSRTGLIEQLEFEGYSTEDATLAVDSLNIDYREQAAESAQNYLEFSGFSRSGLIEQLMFEGYTEEQATYGVDQTGL